MLHICQGLFRSRRVDLSRIDFEALRARFEAGRRRMEAEKLRRRVESTLRMLVTLNRSRMNYAERFQQMIDEYSAGSINVETLFDRLVTFARELTQEEQRSISEQLTEEELAVFDILTRPEMSLNNAERLQVKAAARGLLETLKREKLVLDWRKRQQSRAAVRLTIEEALDKLPERYTPVLYRRKCDAVYQHVFESYYGEGPGHIPRVGVRA